MSRSPVEGSFGHWLGCQRICCAGMLNFGAIDLCCFFCVLHVLFIPNAPDSYYFCLVALIIFTRFKRRKFNNRVQHRFRLVSFIPLLSLC